MIPNPLEIAERLGFSPVLAGFFLAATLTGLVLFVQSITNVLDDRNSQ